MQAYGPSMVLTFNLTGDMFLAERLSIKFGKVDPGDIVLLRSPKSPRKVMVKRLLGLESHSKSWWSACWDWSLILSPMLLTPWKVIDVTLLWYLLSFITLTLFFWNLDFVAKAFSYRLCFVIASVSVVIGSKGTCLGRGRQHL